MIYILFIIIIIKENYLINKIKRLYYKKIYSILVNNNNKIKV